MEFDINEKHEVELVLRAIIERYGENELLNAIAEYKVEAL
jgi:hypothetical protein